MPEYLEPFADNFKDKVGYLVVSHKLFIFSINRKEVFIITSMVAIVFSM